MGQIWWSNHPWGWGSVAHRVFGKTNGPVVEVLTGTASSLSGSWVCLLAESPKLLIEAIYWVLGRFLVSAKFLSFPGHSSMSTSFFWVRQERGESPGSTLQGLGSCFLVTDHLVSPSGGTVSREGSLGTWGVLFERGGAIQVGQNYSYPC